MVSGKQKIGRQAKEQKCSGVNEKTGRYIHGNLMSVGWTALDIEVCKG